MAAKRGRKEYPNLRYKFIRGLINEEKYERRKHWMKHAAEWISRAITTMDLTSVEVKSVKQATELDGIGDKAAMRLGRIVKDQRFSIHPPQPGKFVSSATALLAAMCLLTQEMEKTDILDPTIKLIPEDRLRQVAAALCEEPFQDTDSKNGGQGFCQAWWRLTLLASRGYVKKRSRNKKTVFELLEDGRDVAEELIDGSGLTGYSVCDVLNARVPVKNASSEMDDGQGTSRQYLYTNTDNQDGVLLYVDIQEGGGQRQGLSAICRKMEELGVKYATRRLVTGDYSWIWSYSGQQVELPVLVERKRADDLAGSLADGRYQRQKEKMKNWAQKFAHLPVETVLTYIVEGDPADYVVRCADGCGGVGLCGHPDVQQVQMCIQDLEESDDFKLMRTPDTASTVKLVMTLTRELEHRVKNGDFHCLLKPASIREDVPISHTSCTKSSKLTSKLSRKVTPHEAKAEVKFEAGGIFLEDTTYFMSHQKQNTMIQSSEFDRIEAKALVPMTITSAPSGNPIGGNIKQETPVKAKKRVHLLDDDWLENNPMSTSFSDRFAENKACSPKRQRWQSAPDVIPTPHDNSQDGVIFIEESSLSLPDNATSSVQHESNLQETNRHTWNYHYLNDIKDKVQNDPRPGPSTGTFTGTSSCIESLPSTSDDSQALSSGNETPAEVRWSQELSQIKDIFSNFDLGITVSLLEHHHGDVQLVVSALLDNEN